MIKKIIDNSSKGAIASRANTPELAELMSRIFENKQGYRLETFIEMLQTMSKLPDWKFLSDQVITPAISDYEGLRMNEIYQYTMRNYGKNITLEEIASEIHLTNLFLPWPTKQDLIMFPLSTEYLKVFKAYHPAHILIHIKTSLEMPE